MSEVDNTKPHLRRVSDGDTFELEGDMTIGRHADCNIVIDQEVGVSRFHARFNVVDQDVFVTDLESLNGVLLNGSKVDAKAQLSDGDILIFDENEYEIQIPSQIAEPETDPDVTVMVNRDELLNRLSSATDSHESNEAPVKAVEVKKAAENQPVATKEASPEPVQEVNKSAAVEQPGAWAQSASVDNPDLTTIAAGVLARDAQVPDVDLSAISEPTIIVQSGESAGTMMPLVGDQTEWSIGSTGNRNLQITQDGVSENHASIVREGNKWKIIDQMSRNGTFVNDAKINVRYFDTGDVLRFGPVECLFVKPAGYSQDKSNSSTSQGVPWLKIATTIAVLLLLVGGGYYAISSGLIPLPG